MRVLAPGGVAVVGGKKRVKSKPANTDEWTHYLHDASGNPVAHDEVVGPPRRLQWSDRPLSARSHEHTPSVASVVSSGGRIFYFVDDAARGARSEGRVADLSPRRRAQRLYVYSLRSAAGRLAWRFRAARDDRRLVVDGQLESVWPTHSSVLVRDGVAYVTAGRSSYLDGGIDLYRLEAQTGKYLSRTPIDSLDRETGRQPPQYGPNGMPGVRSDLLSSAGDHIYLRQMVFSKTGEHQEQGAPHLLTVSDFLDATWPHRSYWIFGIHTSLATGCSSREKKLRYGRLLALSPSTLYGYGRKTVHWSNQLQDGPYRIFAVSRSSGSLLWEKGVPVEVVRWW